MTSEKERPVSAPRPDAHDEPVEGPLGADDQEELKRSGVSSPHIETKP